MKTENIIFKIALVMTLTLFFSCVEDEEKAQQDTIVVPETFTIDIPDELSSINTSSSSRILEDDIAISGDDVYDGLRGFIHVGESAAEIIEEIITVVRVTTALNVESFDIVSDEDGRTKSFVFLEDVEYDGVAYAYEMQVSDEDGSLAIQVAWNVAPVDGIAILNPYHIDRRNSADYADVHYSIAYSESSDNSLQKMIVSIEGIQEEEGGLDNLKMVVTKEGDIVEVYGNSNHPDFAIDELITEAARNYAFIARADESLDIGVAEIALPLSTVTTADVMEDHSIYNVFDQAIKDAGFDNQEFIDLILANMQAPGFFADDEFIGAGDMPEGQGFTIEFSDLSDLQPFAPSEVAGLTVSFLE